MIETDPADLCRLAGAMSASSSDVQENFGLAVRGFLSHRSDTAAHLDRTLAKDPQCTLGHLLRGYAVCFLGRRDLHSDVRRHLEKAAIGMKENGSIERERVLYRALQSWLGGDGRAAVGELTRWVEGSPSDALAFRLEHSIRFQLGDSHGMLSSAERAIRSVDRSDPSYGYMLGCLAFALEETGAFSDGERAGREAISRNSHDAWAIHAVAHVLLATDRLDEGVEWLSDHRAIADDLGNFAGHIAWHEALFLLDLGELDRVLELYDRRIAVYPKRDYRDISNATSLLVRLENAGVDVGSRWAAPVEAARERWGDHGLAFADLHYALALVGGGEVELARGYLSSMEDAASHREDEQAIVIRDVGLPAAREIVETIAGTSSNLNRHVALHRGDLAKIGGSWAQRAILDWVADRSFRPANAEFRYGAV